MTVIAPTVPMEVWFKSGVTLVVGLVAALLGMLLTRWMTVIITSIIGAALASRLLTLDQFAAVQQLIHLEPLLFYFRLPVFVALVLLGILSQLGLFRFGYVARIARTLPGSKMWPSRRREETEPAG